MKLLCSTSVQLDGCVKSCSQLQVVERFAGLLLTLPSMMHGQARTDVPKRLLFFAKSACTFQYV